MRKILLTTLLALSTLFAYSQNLYTKTFGNHTNRAIIFLHGGPGHNSANFEFTTAQQLADRGFYVIVYDRRGEGRSRASAQFTFKETFDDLNYIYQKYGLSKSTLIGHSFGGVIATLFAEKYPEKIESLILVGTPVSLQSSFKTILQKSKNIYQTKKDSVNLNYISMLENMDNASLEYCSYCFMHAMQNGFYHPKNPTAEAQSIYEKFKTDSLLIKYSSQASPEAVKGFWANEKYTTIDITANIKHLKTKNMNIYGLYGKDDGLYSPDQIKNLQDILGKNNVIYMDNCSHNVFVDQQSLFIRKVQSWTK